MVPNQRHRERKDTASIDTPTLCAPAPPSPMGTSGSSHHIKIQFIFDESTSVNISAISHSGNLDVTFLANKTGKGNIYTLNLSVSRQEEIHHPSQLI